MLTSVALVLLSWFTADGRRVCRCSEDVQRSEATGETLTSACRPLL